MNDQHCRGDPGPRPISAKVYSAELNLAATVRFGSKPPVLRCRLPCPLSPIADIIPTAQPCRALGARNRVDAPPAIREPPTGALFSGLGVANGRRVAPAHARFVRSTLSLLSRGASKAGFNVATRSNDADCSPEDCTDFRYRCKAASRGAVERFVPVCLSPTEFRQRCSGRRHRGLFRSRRSACRSSEAITDQVVRPSRRSIPYSR